MHDPKRSDRSSPGQLFARADLSNRRGLPCRADRCDVVFVPFADTVEQIQFFAAVRNTHERIVHGLIVQSRELPSGQFGKAIR